MSSLLHTRSVEFHNYVLSATGGVAIFERSLVSGTHMLGAVHEHRGQDNRIPPTHPPTPAEDTFVKFLCLEH